MSSISGSSFATATAAMMLITFRRQCHRIMPGRSYGSRPDFSASARRRPGGIGSSALIPADATTPPITPSTLRDEFIEPSMMPMMILRHRKP